jgi:hypothetical protein
MSRITGSEALGLMNAYDAVYASQISEEEIQEDFENWVNSLVEEGHDLSEYTWEEMYEEYISEAPKVDPKFVAKAAAGGQTAFKAGGGAAAVKAGKSVADVQKAGMAAYRGAGGQTAFRAGGGQQALKSGQSVTNVQKQGERNLFKAGGGSAQMQKTGQTAAQVTAQGSKNIATAAYKAGGGNAQAVKTGQTTAQIQAQGAKNLGAAFKAGGGNAAMKKYGQTAQQVVQKGTEYSAVKAVRAARAAGSPTGAPGTTGSRQPVPGAGKPPVVTTKPVAAPAAAKPAATPAAKPQLGPTGKPLVGGIERRTPTRAEMDAKRSASAIQSSGSSAGSKAFSSPTSGSSAFKAPTIDVATKPDTSNVQQVNKAAAKPTPVTANPSATSTKPGDGKPYAGGPLWEGADVYDVILSYLLDEGYAETEEAATAIMVNMGEEWRQSIVEYSDLNGFKPSAFPNMKQYPAVLNGNQGMVSGQPGASGRGFRKDPKDYKAAVSTIERNTGRKISAPSK